MSNKQEIICETNSYLKIKDILVKNNVSKFLLVCDNAFDFLFIKDYFENIQIPFVKFSKFTPNPVYEDIVMGVELLKKENCDFIVAVGGGSAIDVAKCIKLFSVLDSSVNYLKQEFIKSDMGLIAVPTTAGTGSESTRYAAIYYQGEKQSITHNCIVPDYAILEYKLLETLPEYIKKSAMMDALCQGIESLWSVNSTEESFEYSKKAIKLILDNLDDYIWSNNSKAMKNIMLAANYSGRAINITQTTAAHAMSYKLTSIYGIAHGHAVALCLPSVWTFMNTHPERCIDPRGSSHLERVFNILNKLFEVDNTDHAISKFYTILYKLGLDKSQDYLSDLCDSVNLDRLKNNPIDLGFYGLRSVYRNVLAQKKASSDYSSLRPHQKKSLEAYDWFKNTCDENGISFILLGGSVVGSERHAGFIPWDDDIDIGIRIDDLEKFRKITKSTLPDGFAWSHPDTNLKHPRLFGKIIYEERCCLDLFPIVKTSKNNFKANVHHKKTRLWYKVYLRKIGYGKRPHKMKRLKNKISWIIAKFISIFFSREKILLLNDKNMKKYENKQTERYLSICGRYTLTKELIEKEWLDKQHQYIDFEGKQIPVMHNYKDYLERIYGDYMTMPPVNKRSSDHALRIKMYNINGVIPSYMKKLHEIECEMLEEFINICNVYKLRYYAISGTALGAVRHNGFIPWDDDLDIGMPRKDYDKFLEVAQQHLSKHLFLQTYDTEYGCPRFFAKIRNSNTTFIEVGAHKDTRNRGLYIDVFPLDGFPSNKSQAKKCKKAIKVFDYCINYVYTPFVLRKVIFKSDGIKKIAKRIFGWYLMHTKYRGYDIQQLNSAKEEMCRKFDYDDCEYICSYGGVYGDKEIIPKSFMGDGVSVKFENFDMTIPEKYDEYLRHFYNDYLQFPPEEKRSVGHPRKVVDLEKSYTAYQ